MMSASTRTSPVRSWVLVAALGLVAALIPVFQRPAEAASITTALLSDLEAGSADAEPRLDDSAILDGELLFAANNGLWRTDGESTTLVSDTWVDGTLPQHLHSLAGFVYFEAATGSDPLALWRTDGISVDNLATIGTSGKILAVWQGWVYFAATDSVDGPVIRRTDGTTIEDVVVLSTIGATAVGETKGIGTNLFFVGVDASGSFKDELFYFDGTGVQAATTFGDTTDSHQLQELEPLDTWLFFNKCGPGGDGRWESLYRTDGTTTEFVTEFTSEGTSGCGEFLAHPTALGDQIYFRSVDDTSGAELWRTDGVTTERITDINVGSADSLMQPTEHARATCGRSPWERQPHFCTPTHEEFLYFNADDGTGFGLWRTDGVTVEQVLTTTAWNFVPYGGHLYFSTPYIRSADPQDGFWRAGGIVGTERLLDQPLYGYMNRFEVDGTEHISAGRPPKPFGGSFLFADVDDTHGIEPWTTQGSLSPDSYEIEVVNVRGDSEDDGVWAIASGDGDVWASNTADIFADGIVHRVDGDTVTETVAITVTANPAAMSSDDNGIWVGSHTDGVADATSYLSLIDPSTNSVAASEVIPDGTSSAVTDVETAHTAIWATTHRLLKIDPATLGVITDVDTGQPYQVEANSSRLWVLNTGSVNSYVEVDPSTVSVLREISSTDIFGSTYTPSEFELVGDELWTTEGDNVYVYDAGTGQASTVALPTGCCIAAMASSAGQMWVVNGADQLYRFDVNTRQLLETIALPVPVYDVTVLGDAVWAVGGDGNVVRIRPGLAPTVTVSPDSGTAGTTFTSTGTGFTPDSTVTSHLRKPDGSEFSTLQLSTDSTGGFTHAIDSSGFGVGTYEHWAVDDTTDTESTHATFTVEASGSVAVDIEKEVSTDGRLTWHDADSAPGPDDTVGEHVWFRISITNTGDVTLGGIQVQDDTADLSDCSWPSQLAAGESAVCDEASSTALEGTQSNTASVSGTTSDNRTATDEDVAHYTGHKPPPAPTRYVALGDSFSSGEGVEPFQAHTDTSQNKCHRSQAAYSEVVADSLSAVPRPEFWACSGARLEDVYKNWVDTNGPPWDDPQLEIDGPLKSQLDRLGDDTKLVTISIGGNNLQFAHIVKMCVTIVADCIDQYDAQIALNLQQLTDPSLGFPIDSKWVHLGGTYEQIRERAPRANVLVLGYPRFFPDPHQQDCEQGEGGFITTFTTNEQDWINEKIDKANEAISSLAHQAGLRYVDVYDAFDQHELCRSDSNTPWMNELQLVNREYSFHPNALGQEALANAVISQLVGGEPLHVLPGRALATTATVGQGAGVATFMTRWAGSVVETTLTSPSGRKIDAGTTSTDVAYSTRATYELFNIADPEPGTWTVTLFGRDVPTAGEDVTVQATTSPKPSTETLLARLAGVDRFDTAARVSEARFPPNVDTAYVATGLNFPDALAGGAAAGVTGSPVLLVLPDSIPDPTAAELVRLNPSRIVVLGGAAAVAETVVDALETHADEVVRFAGPDRFATAAAVSRATFDPDVPVAYIATGLNFPDALSGSAAAIRDGGPVLLVAQDHIPDPTAAELDRLRPQRIVVLGGSVAVADTVANDLARYTSGSVDRYAGANRFETATDVSAHVFADSSQGTAYVATGLNFPDALAGAAAAGYADAPILLVPAEGNVPNSLIAELQRLTPRQVLVLGGTAAVSDGMMDDLGGALP